MYGLLLVFGEVITAAGIAVLVSGVSVQDYTYDTNVVTLGINAAIGGLVVIGFGLAVRMLRRIERALNALPMPRLAHSGEVSVAVAATEQPGAPAAIAFPPEPESRPLTAPVAGASAPQPAPAEEAALERFRKKFPTLVRLENAPVVEETDVSVLPRAPARAGEAVGEVAQGFARARVNGSAPPRTVPRPEANSRSASVPEQPKNSMFDSLWPKVQRQRRGAQTAPAQVVPLPAVEPDSEPWPDAQPPAIQDEAPPAVSILKSGVVDGMAYTLYSDGSIEAQLPQGTLRFGSITELRNHIEQGS